MLQYFQVWSGIGHSNVSGSKWMAECTELWDTLLLIVHTVLEIVAYIKQYALMNIEVASSCHFASRYFRF